ncbi:glycoside hydrolase 100 family protein [Candidatus Latescibacterota bacterium]
MKKEQTELIAQVKNAALNVLLHNLHGPFRGLPRTAGWGYPEAYTRDMMISLLGVLVSKKEHLIKSYGKVLEYLAKNQSSMGHIPSLAHDSLDRGASDTTPLFLFGTAIYRSATGQNDFLQNAVDKAVRWMEFQSPDDNVLVGQLPTSDWRDEQWVIGYGLYVNTLVYAYLKLLGFDERAEKLKELMSRFTITGERQHKHVHEGLVFKNKPYYAMWSYKIYKSERFDLLGNSLAILNGIASPSRAESMVKWIEDECEAMKDKGELSVNLPPNFFPFIKPYDPDWRPRYETYNRPGEYHNGGIWPFVCGFYVAALIAADKHRLAQQKLYELAKLCRLKCRDNIEFGFNEWIKSQDSKPAGNDYQTWSAAMFLYACYCVENKTTPFFGEIRNNVKSEINITSSEI